MLILAEPNRFDQQVESTYFPPSGGGYGIRIPQHPALQPFPHDGFPNLQFYSLFEDGSEFRLEGPEGSSANIQPIIEGLRITRARRSNQISHFTVLFEAKVGSGKLLLSTLNIRRNLNEDHPEAVYLLDRFLRYVSSKAFDPHCVMAAKQFSDLVVPYVKMIHSF